MFAIVRTGGKQYRVAPGDKIAVEKLAGEAGDTITLGDILLAGDGGEIKDSAKVTVSAEIIAQAKSEKVIVFKKRRRHNYRRKAGHRQQLTLLRILAVGDSKAEPKKAAAKTDAAPKAVPSEPAKGADVNTSEKLQKAAPVKDAAPAAKAEKAPKIAEKTAEPKKAAAPKKDAKPAAEKAAAPKDAKPARSANAPAKKPAAKK
jgi:large subunit ribosomal protein L21